MSELAVSLSCQDESEVFHQIKSPLHLWRVFHVETLNKLWIWYELALPSWIKGNSCGHFVKGDIHPVYLLLYLTFKYQRFTSLDGEYLKKKACIWLNRWNKFMFQGSANPIYLNQHNSRISWSRYDWRFYFTPILEISAETNWKYVSRSFMFVTSRPEPWCCVAKKWTVEPCSSRKDKKIPFVMLHIIDFFAPTIVLNVWSKQILPNSNAKIFAL